MAGFLGVEADSAPETLSLEEAEPPRSTVQEACGTHVELDDREFDFVAWRCAIMIRKGVEGRPFGDKPYATKSLSAGSKRGVGKKGVGISIDNYQTCNLHV